MQRNYMIEAHETLLRITYMPAGRATFILESPFFGQVMCEQRVLETLNDDDIMRVARMHTGTLQMQDITEECAKAYIEDWNNRFDELEASDEKTLPAYVKYSHAWATYKDEIEAMRPVKPRRSLKPSIKLNVYSALENRT